MKKLAILGLIIVGCTSGDKVSRDRFFIQGNEALANSEFDRAIEFYDKAIALDSAFARGYNNRGVARIEDDHPYEAIQDYNRAIALDSAYYDAVFNRAYAYEQIGKYTQSLEDIATVKSVYPDSAYVYFYEGLLYSRLKDYDQGISSFRKSLALDSTNHEAKINLATIHYFKGTHGEAKRLLIEVLEKYPSEPNALNTMSQIYLDQSDYQNALITINQALKRVPDEPYFLNNRGQIYLDMDSLDLALKDINRSIYLNPDNAWAYRNKGIYYMELGRYDDAVRLFNQSIGRNEFIDEVYIHLGYAYHELGKKQLACQAWKTGIEQQEEKAQEAYVKYCD